MKKVENQYAVYEGGMFFASSILVQDLDVNWLSHELRVEFVQIGFHLYYVKGLTPYLLSLADVSAYEQKGVWLSISPLLTMNEGQLYRWLNQHIHTHILYGEHSALISIDEAYMATINKEKPDTALLEKWRIVTKQLRWLVSSEEWERWIELTELTKPPGEQLYELIEDLNRQYVLLINWSLKIKESLQLKYALTWENIKGWIELMSIHIKERIDQQAMSEDVSVSLLKAVAIMHMKLTSHTTQEDIAKEVNMSRSYFSQCFKRFYGQSFGEVLKSQRIEEAKRLLLHTSHSVAEIAHVVGFEDAKYFSRTFKHFVGAYPSEYRLIN